MEAEFAKTEAETSKDKAEEEAYDGGVADTQAVLKAQIPGGMPALLVPGLE